MKSLDFDWILLLTMLSLVTLGLVVIYSASALSAYQMIGESGYFFQKQLVWSFIGLIACFVAATIPLDLVQKLTPLFYIVVNILLILVLIPSIGREAGGARRWIDLGIVGFQPSELAKVAVVLTIGSLVSQAEFSDKNTVRNLLYISAIAFLPVVLISLEPDIGTAFIVVLLAGLMMFLSGFPVTYLIFLGALSLPFGILTIFTSGYRTERILAYVNPWGDPYDKGYHVIQSIRALNSGGLVGKGLGQSKLKMGYLPEPYTDTIISVMGEELGFLGILLLVGLMGFLIYKGFAVSIQARDVFQQISGVGLTALIGIQAGMNLAVISGLIPTTGVAMPFISYGGSALVTNMMVIGLLLNISRGGSV